MRAAVVRIGRRLAASTALLLLTCCSVAVADPTVTAVAQPNPVEIGQLVSFSANAATDPGASIIEYDWDFGDGDTCLDCGPSTSYTYQQVGQYTVTVTVTDSNFATSSSTTPIDVTPVPPLPPTPPSSGVRGGAGAITLGGRVGNLQLDRSNQDDVIVFAGAPDATGSGNFDAIPHTPNFLALGYACSPNASPGLGPVDDSVFCKTVFYINDRTQRLAAFHSSSPHYSFRTASPGMGTARAERKVHRIAQGGCLSGFNFFHRRNHASLFGEVDGGRATLRRDGSHTILRLSGGRLETLELESNRQPVGLLFC